ncbi:MAG: undecaprenyldiphospho-muramoylpentapeptide beta-N-acetylglucosaminyltransferase [Tissierellaceae bacterium]|nr:undecaprenyldiphospho-muramoylpentapeptide beta-N-acetylglucosaminyltransferase [Tissierellaceae bacterium]
MRYIISGGGTGGHIYPALAIAKEIKYFDKNAEILYIGTKDSLESELVPKEGIEFKAIRVKGLPRKLNKNSFIALKELLIGLNQSQDIIRQFKPDIVIGTGGYVCGPIVYKAAKNNIPTLIHEQNAFPGITNKILSRYVDKVATTFDEAAKYFKFPDRVVNTGNPIRREIFNKDKELSYKVLNMESKKPLVLSFGGSGGQKKLNDAILDILLNNKWSNDLQLIHITGKRLFDSFMKEIKDSNIVLNKNIRILPYLYEMPEALNIADLLISSSGAITLAETSAIGLPSILIPKGYTAENHQEYNARAFEKSGASIVILEKDLNGEVLVNTINDLMNDKLKLKNMSINSKKLGNKDATKEIVKIISEIIAK